MQQRHSHTETRLGFIEHSWHSLNQWCHPGEWASNMGISKFLKWETPGTDIMRSRRYWTHYGRKVRLQHFGVCVFSLFFLFFYFFFYQGDNSELWRLCAHKSWSQITCFKSENIEAWLEVFMWWCWRVLISGFRLCQRNLLFSAWDCNVAWHRL